MNPQNIIVNNVSNSEIVNNMIRCFLLLIGFIKIIDIVNICKIKNTQVSIIISFLISIGFGYSIAAIIIIILPTKKEKIEHINL